MNELRWESGAAMLAFLITFGYIWAPGPYWMGAFTFIAQPLFLLALLSYGIKVFQELKQRQIL